MDILKKIFCFIFTILLSICFVIFLVWFLDNRIEKPEKQEEVKESVEQEEGKENIEKEEIKEEVKEEKDPFVSKLEQEKYYIPTRLERYKAYNDGVKTTKEIVTEVNCNIDREFYTNTVLSDYSKNNLILVNKYYYVDNTYKPKDATTLTYNKYTYWEDSVLSKDAYNAFVKMVNEAKTLGYSLIDTSAYRSYEYQSYLYNKYLNEKGLEWTLKSSAKPGHSEHHTGLATDIVKVGVSMYDFEGTKEFNWLSKNAHKYGFILRYPKGKEYLTGYKYEPWHYRYVGVDAATYIYENNIVFEEYYAYFCEYKGEC